MNITGISLLILLYYLKNFY
ncbi:hypothetical protein NWO25_04185 [Enterococcus lactis]|nr:hypothetical protein [Enterococcus lactis]